MRPTSGTTATYQWFGDLGEVVPEQAAELDALTRASSDVGLVLPEDFTTFHTRSEHSYHLAYWLVLNEEGLEPDQQQRAYLEAVIKVR